MRTTFSGAAGPGQYVRRVLAAPGMVRTGGRRLQPLPEGVTWNSTYCALAENKAYCHWEAPTKEAVEEILKKYEVPYEAVYPVRLFDPATGKLEG